MVKLNKIYTRTGDDGTAALVDGSRSRKSSALFAAIGDVDEANSAIGVAIAALEPGPVADALTRFQNDMFDLGADLATPAGIAGALRVTAAHVDAVEAAIDRLNADLSPLTSFVLPGGSAGAASLHLARAIVRRAERAAVRASDESELSPAILSYLNRLSDYLFVAARWVNQRGASDVLWVPGSSLG
jgi:cob(I)alamin adenosyltransferase